LGYCTWDTCGKRLAAWITFEVVRAYCWCVRS
jgi:hypothetical protein